MGLDATDLDLRASTDMIRRRKGGEPIVCLTAYTYPVARLLDDHVDLLLVGDSVAMVLHGHKTTLGASIEMMIAHRPRKPLPRRGASSTRPAARP